MREPVQASSVASMISRRVPELARPVSRAADATSPVSRPRAPHSAPARRAGAAACTSAAWVTFAWRIRSNRRIAGIP